MRKATGNLVWVLMLSCLLLTMSPVMAQAQYTGYVDDDAPNDPGPGDPTVSDPLENGSPLHPFDSIQEAIDVATSGDTILVLNGTYTGDGNRDMHFIGQDITLKSVYGPTTCIIDGQNTTEDHYAFQIDSGESEAAVIQGFTITNFEHSTSAAGINIENASPSILGNVITGNDSDFSGGGILIENSAAKIVGNDIHGNDGSNGGAIVIMSNSTPQVTNNLIRDNYSIGITGGNTGAVFCWTDSTANPCTPLIVNNTIVDNGSLSGTSGIWAGVLAAPIVRNCIIHGNSHEQINLNGTGSVSYSDVEGGFPGMGNIDLDPLFVSGPLGDYYLSQVAAGQAVDSPCVNTGGDIAASVCLTLPSGVYCINEAATRSDTINDTDQVDMGYHYPALNPHTASLNCLPDSGVLPFSCYFTVGIYNLLDTEWRQLSARINVTLANNHSYLNWRAGSLVLSPGESYSTGWLQSIPQLPSLVGVNSFVMTAHDVTPAPYNQPPYSPSGSTDWARCTVTGVAP